METIEREETRPIKSRSVLVRIDPGLEKRVQKQADALNIKLATFFRNAVRFYLQDLERTTFFRNAVRFYLQDLERNNAEVREVIRGIIYSKLDRLERELDQGRMVIFTSIIPVNPAMGSSVCVDEDDQKYIVYEITLRDGDTRISAIDRFADRLYAEWKFLDAERQDEFISNLHSDHVCFTIKALSND